MMINISVYTLASLTFLSFITVIAADIADPCPSYLQKTHNIADMCTDDSVEENGVYGSKTVDSVLLRITKHQSNCICYVSLQKPVTNYTIYMSKYEEQQIAAPEQQNCGLAVDVVYIDTSDITRTLQSINCTSGTGVRSIALGGNELKLQSRIQSGDFTRGYCMQIYKNEAIYTCTMLNQANSAGNDDDWINGTEYTSFDECKQYCLKTETCIAVHYEDGNKYCFVYNQTSSIKSKEGSTYAQKSCVDTQKLKIKCYPPEPTTIASQETTTDITIPTKTDTVTTPIRDSTITSFDTPSSITAKDASNKGKNSDLYVYIGAGAGGLLMILLISCIIVCIRKKSNQTSEKDYAKNQFCSDSKDSDNDYDGLKDNVLYVSSEPEPNEILEDGNYNTVDLEQTRKVNQDNTFDGNYSTVDGICNIIGRDSSLSKSKPVIKPKPKTSFKGGSVEETINLSTMDNSNNEYAVVDKGRNSDDVKHTNPEHGNDTEYAVVNKVRRSSYNN